MKKSKKLLSILLAVVMVFSVVAVPVSAAVPSDVKELDALIEPANLAGLVDWLLTSLNNRKKQYADTVLNFVCAFVEDIKAEVPEGTDVFNDNVATSTKATYVMNFLDKMLAEENLNSALGETVPKIADFFGITINLNSVNGILATLQSLNGVKGLAGGDIAALNLNALIVDEFIGSSAQSRENTGDLQIIYNLLQFLADNKTILKNFLKGELNFGNLKSILGDLADEVNGYASEITVMIEDLVYEKLLGAPDGKASHAESAYKNWTVDQMAIGALVKMLTGAVPADTDEINNFLNKPVYDLLAYYGDRLYDSFLVDILQNDLMGVIKQYAEGNALAQYFNMDVTFTGFANDLAGKVNFAENGIFAEVNNLVVALLEKVIANDVFVKLGLVTGGNENLNANLEKVIKYILPRMAAILDPAEFDFSMYTQDYVAEKTLAELAPGILKIFYPGWFHLEAADIDVVEQIDTMGEAAALAVYYALIAFNDVMFTTEDAYDYVSEWNSMIFEADGVTLRDLGNSEWGNICLSMAADAAMFGFALNGGNFFFDFDMNDIKDAKENGWDGVAFLDEIADWGIDMVKGLPAVTDHLNGKRGVVNDNYGPFYKLNVLLNEILDWSFLNGVSYGSFNLDIETLIFDGILGNVYEFDIAGILGLFAVNNKQGNVLNLNTVPALLSIVDNVLNILFSHSGAAKNVNVEATCANVGFSVSACSKCGLYLNNYKETEKTEHVKVPETIREATCSLGGIVRYTCTQCDYVSREDTAKTPCQPGGFEQLEENGNIYIAQYCTVCGELYSKTLMTSLDSIEIVSLPDKLEYELNEEGGLNLDGIVVNAIYSDGEIEPIDITALTIEKNVDTSVAGEQDVVIAYYAATATFTVTVVDNSAPAYILGDATGNGIVNSEDARAALRCAVGLEPLTGDNALAADFNKDGAITSVDARAILRFAVGLPID